jgi:hypothetical protein
VPFENISEKARKAAGRRHHAACGRKEAKEAGGRPPFSSPRNMSTGKEFTKRVSVEQKPENCARFEKKWADDRMRNCDHL